MSERCAYCGDVRRGDGSCPTCNPTDWRALADDLFAKLVRGVHIVSMGSDLYSHEDADAWLMKANAVMARYREARK